MRHAGQVVTRTMLLENVWEYHFDPQTNVIDVHVSRLRAKSKRDSAGRFSIQFAAPGTCSRRRAGNDGQAACHDVDHSRKAVGTLPCPILALRLRLGVLHDCPGGALPDVADKGGNYQEVEILSAVYQRTGIAGLVRALTGAPGARCKSLHDNRSVRCCSCGNVADIDAAVMRNEGWTARPFEYLRFAGDGVEPAHQALAHVFVLPNQMRILVGRDLGEPNVSGKLFKGR